MLFFLCLCLKINKKQAIIRKHEKNLYRHLNVIRIKKSTSAEWFLISHVENTNHSTMNTGTISQCFPRLYRTQLFCYIYKNSFYEVILPW